MLYLYDVWVNWFVGEESGYNVCAFHEWRNNDQIEILEQVPVLFVTESVYDDIENNLHQLPQVLLDKIHRKSFVRRGHNRKILEYVCIITDGRGTLVFDTIGYNVPYKKSRLIPKQEQRVLDLIKEQKCHTFKLIKSSKKTDTNINQINADKMYGLTRRERQLKRLLMIAVQQMKNKSDKKEITYWLSELTGEDRHGEKPIEELWNSLLVAVKEGWSKQHEEVCEKIIRGNGLLEGLWKLEKKASQNISK